MEGSTLFMQFNSVFALVQFIKEVYWEYEYEEVVTPNIYNFDLWKTSGHADHYKQNMFSFDIEKQEFGLKPMNCPGEQHPDDALQSGKSCSLRAYLNGQKPCLQWIHNLRFVYRRCKRSAAQQRNGKNDNMLHTCLRLDTQAPVLTPTRA